MAKERKPDFSIASILGGQTNLYHRYLPGQFLDSAGIDPDLPYTANGGKPTDAIIASKYAKFSSTAVDSAPMWFMADPKDSKVYAYLSNGSLISYSSSLTSETDETTPTSGAGNGAAYYNNYLYLATPTDVSRWGPLNGSQSITNTYWTSTLGLTALVDTSYSGINDVVAPNHPMHVHADGALYFLDFKNGQGLVHKIKTTKASVEGDTNDGSAYNVLDLPFGYQPTDLESFGTDLAIIANQAIDTNLMYGTAALFLWDTTSDTFYGQIPLGNARATAIINHNGVLKIFSSRGIDGLWVSQYTGGYQVQDVDFINGAASPFPGAVDTYGEKLMAGTIDVSDVPQVYAWGSKTPQIPKGVRHSMARSTSTGVDPTVSAIKAVQFVGSNFPRVIIGWRDDSNTGIDSFGGTPNGVFKSEVFLVNQPFEIDRIRIPLNEAVSANTTIAVSIYYDDGSTTKAMDTINNTNFSGKWFVNYYAQQIADKSPTDFLAQRNFYLQFTITGTAENRIMLPVEIWITRHEDTE